MSEDDGDNTGDSLFLSECIVREILNRLVVAVNLDSIEWLNCVCKPCCCEARDDVRVKGEPDMLSSRDLLESMLMFTLLRWSSSKLSWYSSKVITSWLLRWHEDGGDSCLPRESWFFRWSKQRHASSLTVLDLKLFIWSTLTTTKSWCRWGVKGSSSLCCLLLFLIHLMMHFMMHFMMELQDRQWISCVNKAIVDEEREDEHFLGLLFLGIKRGRCLVWAFKSTTKLDTSLWRYQSLTIPVSDGTEKVFFQLFLALLYCLNLFLPNSSLIRSTFPPLKYSHTTTTRHLLDFFRLKRVMLCKTRGNEYTPLQVMKQQVVDSFG